MSIGTSEAGYPESLVEGREYRSPDVAARPTQTEKIIQPSETLVSSMSLVLPAYNEEESIGEAVRRALSALAKYCDAFEVIVVNDGSVDRTGQVLDGLQREHANVRVVHHPQNKGYGAALCSGIYSARFSYISFMDSDLQFNPEEFHALLRWASDYDIVAGYRVDRADPWIRKFNAWAWNSLVRLVLNVKVRDIDCAFKVFRREVFDTIKLESVGAMVNTEIFARSRMHGFTLREIPVSHFPRQHGEQTGANLSVIAKAFRELFAIQGKLRRQHKGFRKYGVLAPESQNQ
jgi:glycosyltransferase involved in cell wall biosynthesis